MPEAFIQIALLIIIIRSVFMVFLLSQHLNRQWLDLLYYMAVALVATAFLLQ
ncbi:hypothetical protein P9314_20640 [Paenibacillus validus]|uniref:hypothetical protein n=1 Tax=Paenibacillus TaxID=44249 RepID=UPI0012D9C03D|nr:hypothetical protein [Paenibacillus validus]MED4603034.1 hypothetical protein [Paenibacillus validus]MED4608691.1 hypothetical protein [Paenibacillus validus]